MRGRRFSPRTPLPQRPNPARARLPPASHCPTCRRQLARRSRRFCFLRDEPRALDLTNSYWIARRMRARAARAARASVVEPTDQLPSSSLLCRPARRAGQRKVDPPQNGGHGNHRPVRAGMVLRMMPTISEIARTSSPPVSGPCGRSPRPVPTEPFSTSRRSNNRRV